MTTTTAAATQAGVTVATIRTWCRNGVIAATKAVGRWVIDTTSLAHRIAIGTMRVRKQAPVEPVKLTREERAARSQEIRDRICASLTALPALTGSDKQIAWAEEIREARITQALGFVAVRRDGVTLYGLQISGQDPLRVSDFRGLQPSSGTWETEQELIDAARTALTGRDYFGGDRTASSWWIDNRNR